MKQENISLLTGQGLLALFLFMCLGGFCALILGINFYNYQLMQDTFYNVFALFNGRLLQDKGMIAASINPLKDIISYLIFSLFNTRPAIYTFMCGTLAGAAFFTIYRNCLLLFKSYAPLCAAGVLLLFLSGANTYNLLTAFSAPWVALILLNLAFYNLFKTGELSIKRAICAGVLLGAAAAMSNIWFYAAAAIFLCFVFLGIKNKTDKKIILFFSLSFIAAMAVLLGPWLLFLQAATNHNGSFFSNILSIAQRRAILNELQILKIIFYSAPFISFIVLFSKPLNIMRRKFDATRLAVSTLCGAAVLFMLFLLYKIFTSAYSLTADDYAAISFFSAFSIVFIIYALPKKAFFIAIAFLPVFLFLKAEPAQFTLKKVQTDFVIRPAQVGIKPGSVILSTYRPHISLLLSADKESKIINMEEQSVYTYKFLNSGELANTSATVYLVTKHFSKNMVEGKALDSFIPAKTHSGLKLKNCRHFTDNYFIYINTYNYFCETEKI
ncbi:hypothetical protein Dip510_000030 [Elusimicrobium posterum]|uniref:hypothetical protein n=1 Tax=Elusimicrobium posterum TaxID=3116653 RepID=UPI003C78869F